MHRDDSNDPAQQSAVLPVGAFSRRYLLVLIAVALLVIVDQALIQPALVGLSGYAPLINLAGRQRMLSQKVAKEALAVAVGGAGVDPTVDYRRQLRATVARWTAAHLALVADAAGATRGDRLAIALALAEAERPLVGVVAAARRLAGDEAPPPASAERLAALLAHEAEFLTAMERVVSLYEAAAARQVRWLRICGLAATSAILALLGGVYFTVLRPATRLIRKQIDRLAASEFRHRTLSVELGAARDQLEIRVLERTDQLSRANAALALEMARRQRTEQRTRELAAELAQAARVTALGQLATGLAHEINQPLASIVSYCDAAELLLEENPPRAPASREAIGQAKQAALRAGAIVRRMRNFMRRGPAAAVRLDLNLLAAEVCELCRPQLAQGGVACELAPAQRPAWVLADAIEIQQVLVNLIQNAQDALAEVPRQRRLIALRITTTEDEVRVDVSDTGPGFAAGAIDTALGPFYSTKADGLGMGLAISRTILDRYQGRLAADNPPQGGARVTIHLPLLSPHDADRAATAHCLCG